MRSEKELRDRCERLRAHVLARDLATVEELTEHWPREESDLWDWVRCFGQMARFVAREERGEPQRLEAEEKILAGLREEPVEVRLLDGRQVKVYPKGLDALLWFRAKDWLVALLANRVEGLREAMVAGTLDRKQIESPATFLDACERELSYQLAIMCWQACQQGPQLRSEDEAHAKLGGFIDMEPVDIVRINHGFVEVNGLRVMAIDQILKPVMRKGREERMSWNVFLGTLATRLKTDPATLAKDRSLVSLLLQVRLAAPQPLEEALEE